MLENMNFQYLATDKTSATSKQKCKINWIGKTILERMGESLWTQVLETPNNLLNCKYKGYDFSIKKKVGESEGKVERNIKGYSLSPL